MKNLGEASVKAMIRTATNNKSAWRPNNNCVDFIIDTLIAGDYKISKEGKSGIAYPRKEVVGGDGALQPILEKWNSVIGKWAETIIISKTIWLGKVKTKEYNKDYDRSKTKER